MSFYCRDIIASQHDTLPKRLKPRCTPEKAPSQAGLRRYYDKVRNYCEIGAK